MPNWLWRVLYCPVNFIADSRDAAWETGGRTLCSVNRGEPVQVVWQAGTSGGVCEPASFGGDVRAIITGCADPVDGVGRGNGAKLTILSDRMAADHT